VWRKEEEKAGERMRQDRGMKTSRWSQNKEEGIKQNMYNQERMKDKDEKRGGR
jgi:hypothetical protein